MRLFWKSLAGDFCLRSVAVDFFRRLLRDTFEGEFYRRVFARKLSWRLLWKSLLRDF